MFLQQAVHRAVAPAQLQRGIGHQTAATGGAGQLVVGDLLQQRPHAGDGGAVFCQQRNVGRSLAVITAQGVLEQPVLAFEGVVQAAARQAGAVHQILDRGGGIAFLPENVHRRVGGVIGVEVGSMHGR
ncbi:hypothetical protein D3C72_1815510 [compost metagenome]